MVKANTEVILKCPKCGKVEGQMNAGHGKSGSQRCICRSCNYKYTLNPKTRAYSDELRQKALQLYYSGISGREVGRILNINKASVFNWIKKSGKSLNERNE